MTEDFAQTTLCPVSRHRATEAPRSDDTESVAVEGVGEGEDGHVRCHYAPSLLLDERELAASSQADAVTEPQGHLGVAGRDVDPRGLVNAVLRGRRDRQALATLRTAALEDETAVLCRHPDEETVGAPTTTLVGLIRTLHGTPAQATTAVLEKPGS
jgi:hypothetical protein